MPAPLAPPGTLELAGTRVGGGPVVVRDAAGDAIATIDLRPGNDVALTLPPGVYSVEDSAQGGRLRLSVEPGKVSRFELRPDGAGAVGAGAVGAAVGAGAAGAAVGACVGGVCARAWVEPRLRAVNTATAVRPRAWCRGVGAPGCVADVRTVLLPS